MSDDINKTSNLSLATSFGANDNFVIVKDTGGVKTTRQLSAQSLFQNSTITIANSTQLGTVRVGNSISQDSNGTISITGYTGSVAVSGGSIVVNNGIITNFTPS